MSPARYWAAFNCLVMAVQDGEVTKGRRTDLPGIACNYGRCYRLKREEVEAILGLTVRDLLEKMEVPFGTRAKRKGD